MKRKTRTRGKRNVKNEKPESAVGTSKPTQARQRRNVKGIENTEDIASKNNEVKQDSEKKLKTNKAVKGTKGKGTNSVPAELKYYIEEIPENSEDSRSNKVIEEKKYAPICRCNVKNYKNNQVVKHESFTA